MSYISREELLKKERYLDDWNIDLSYVEVEDIKSIPSADVRENAKGEWIEKEVFDGDTAYECSECGELFCLIDGTPTDNLYNFCPNCGADMRGKDEIN